MVTSMQSVFQDFAYNIVNNIYLPFHMTIGQQGLHVLHKLQQYI